MRRFFIALGLSLMLGQPLSAENAVYSTSVSAVELHPDGVRITRGFDINLPAGTHRLAFRDFRIDGNIGSLQVDFGAARVRISGFQITIGALSPVAPFETAARQAARETWLAARRKWQDINKRHDALAARLEGAKLRVAWMKSLATKGAAKAGLPTAQEISDTSGAMADVLVAARKEIADTQQAIDNMAEELARARKARDAAFAYYESLKPADPNKRELSFVIRLDQPYSGPARLTYLSGDAWWRANYELRLEQQGASGNATLVRRAAIRNSSGERWDGVKASLSTSLLFGKTSVADPRPRTAWIDDKAPPRTSLRKAMPQAQGLAMAEPTPAIAESRSGFSGSSKPVLRGQVLEFDIPDRLALSGDSGAVVWLDTVPLDVSLAAKIVPARDEKAYLAARLTNKTGGPILPGSVNIFRNGIYIGEGKIPPVGIGADFELSFGEYDGIEVTRRLAERMDGDVGIISSRNNRVIRHLTTIKSHLDFAMPVRVLDAIPVSRDEKLVITMQASPRPDETDVDGNRGVVAWNFDLPAGGKKKIEFGYEAKWPPEKVFRTSR